MKLNHSRYSHSLAFCCFCFPLCHTLLSHSPSPSSQRNMKGLLHSAWSTCHFFSFKMNKIFRHHFQYGNMICTLPTCFNATEIMSLFCLALVINLFIALCLPSLSAQQPLGADAPCMKDTQALQSQWCSWASGHALLSRSTVLVKDTAAGKPELWKGWSAHVFQWSSRALRYLYSS